MGILGIKMRKEPRGATPLDFIGRLGFYSKNQINDCYHQIPYKMKIDFVDHLHSLRSSNPISQPSDQKKSPAKAELLRPLGMHPRNANQPTTQEQLAKRSIA